MAKRRNKSKKNVGVKLLPISITIFIVLGIIALLLIWNKGKIGGYSLVKIETASDEAVPQEPEDKLEIVLEKKYLSSKTKEKSEIGVLLNGEELELSELELSSSNEDVVKIQAGMVKAVANGKSTITAKKDDLETSVDLHVITPIKSIEFSTPSSKIEVGEQVQMKLVTKPSDANIETLEYESSDEEIATVNSNGIVTGVSPGKVTITVIDTYTETEKSVTVTIKK